MSEYTKGPWRVSDQVSHRVVDDFATIAHCNVSSRFTNEAEANARLISAAPELLEALKAAEIGLMLCAPLPGYDMNTLHLIRAAIAKAEGK